MRLCDLGPLTVVVGTEAEPVLGEKAAAVLARLAIDVNRRVSGDALLAAAWGDHPTAGAESTLRSHVWRLRRTLEPDRPRGRASVVLVNDADGYRLVGGPATMDSLMFSEALGDVHDLAAAGDAESAVRRADSALALWRGTPYGALGDRDWARPAVDRWEQMRRRLLRRRIRALLDVDAADVALVDLEPLVAADPYDQALRMLQMEALHRTGRTDLAAERYQRARRLLVEDLGTEPGAPMRDLLGLILRDDPALRPPSPPPARSSRSPAIHLPEVMSPTVGRADVLADLADLVRNRRWVTLAGAAGCGKTRVAVDVARHVSPDFTDGVWFVDLSVVARPEDVVEAVLTTLGLTGQAAAPPSQVLRRHLQTRRMLLVLDNCEHLLDGVDALVRTTLGDPDVHAECCLLLTSREPIGNEGELVWNLRPLGLPDVALALGPGASPRAPSVELFLQRVATVSPTLVVDEQAQALAARIALAVDGLPLALELAAARTPSWSLAEIAAQVSADPGGLGRVARGPRGQHATVRAAVDWSYRLLDDDEQRAHRRLAVLPGAFTTDAAAAVLAAPGEPRSDVGGVLARLVHRSMLTSEISPVATGRTRFRQLAVIRSHAAHALHEVEETEGAASVRDAWTSQLVLARPPLGTRDEVAWYRTIDEDYPAVRATLERQLIGRPAVLGGRMAYQLAYYWYYRERLVEAARWLRLASAALRGAGVTERLLARLWSAAAEVTRRRHEVVAPALAGLDEALRDVPSGRLVAVGEGLAGLALSAYVHEEPDLLHAVFRRLEQTSREAADDNLALLTDTVRCCDLLLQGHSAAAVDLAEHVHVRAADAGNLLAAYTSTAPLIAVALRRSRPDLGMPWIDRCLRIHLELGSGSVGMFVETKADFAAQLGDLPQAARLYSASRAITRRAGLGWPNREWTHPLLARTRSGLSREDYERCWREGEALRPHDLVGA